MPFIDLNALGSNSSNASQAAGAAPVPPVANTTAAPVPVPAPQTDTQPQPAPTPGLNGLREVQGPQFPDGGEDETAQITQITSEPKPEADVLPVMVDPFEVVPAPAAEAADPAPVADANVPAIPVETSIEPVLPPIAEPIPAAPAMEPAEDAALESEPVVPPKEDLAELVLGTENTGSTESTTTAATSEPEPSIWDTPTEDTQQETVEEPQAVTPIATEVNISTVPEANTETSADSLGLPPLPEMSPDVGAAPEAEMTTETPVEPAVVMPEETAIEPSAESIEPIDVPESAVPTPITAATEPAVSLTASSSTPQLTTKTYTLHDLLTQVVEMNASDLHLTAGYRAIARVDGKLTEIQSQLLEHDDIKSMLTEVVANHRNADLERDKDLDLSYELTDPQCRFRVNIFYQNSSIAAVFRVIPSKIRTPEELKLPQLVTEFTTLPQGLVLVTGPTGSGKTTTLASMINHINMTQPRHIVTIEDPIEYVYPHGAGLVDQRAVYIDTNDWQDALRSVLRQDPDVVLIGEMRDNETMEAALQVAETGHLVFSTLHTNSASQTIDRLIDAFPEDKQSQVRNQLASTLMAVVSQRLIPTAGGGRRVAAEIMVVTTAIRNAIREKKVFQIDNMIQTSAELGMISLEKALVGLVREGVISVEVAQSYANKPDDILTYLGKS